MKSCKIHGLIGYVLFLWCSACTPEEHKTTQEIGITSPIDIDSPYLRDPNSTRDKRLTVEKAFLQLPEEKLLLEGLKSLSKLDRKLLLKSDDNRYYNCTIIGNYLEIIEKANNVEDEQELLERLAIGVYNSLTKHPVVFVSQELIEEERGQKRVVEQQFLEYHAGQWSVINHQLPTISTTTFFEAQELANSTQQHHIYFDLQAIDVNYLQARLQHELYPTQDSTALKEAYKVAYVWSGSEFNLYRQAMVQYEISEHHSRQ